MIIKNFSGWLFEQTQPATVNKNLTKRVNFPTGFHSAAKANLDKILAPSLADIEKFLKDNKGQVIQVELFGSESAVTNYDNEVVPKAKLAAGELSKKRISTIKTFMSNWLDGLVAKGVITQKPEFKETVYTQPASEWNPPAGATPEQIRALASQEKYTKEQYLEVRLSVIGVGATIESDFIKNVDSALTQSARQAGYATASEFNKTVFYNYSVAPGAVLGKTLAEIKEMPGALLTMNDRVRIQKAIDSKIIKLKPFSFAFEGIGGQIVNVIVHNPSGKVWTGWGSVVAPSYKITIEGYNEGTQEWKWAWMVVYWYFMRSAPKDWQYIANKPNDIDWSFIDRALTLKGTPPTTSIEDQAKQWPDQASLDRYVTMVKSFYSKK